MLNHVVVIGHGTLACNNIDFGCFFFNMEEDERKHVNITLMFTQCG